MAKYHKLRKIDSGGFGVVYEARRLEDGMRVALKELSGSDFSERELRRFMREVRMQAQLHHPNVVPIVGYNVEVVPPWFAMPLAAGNLRDRLETIEGDHALAESIFAQILNGVEHAHANGVIHRDLKPENILAFEEKGTTVWKVGDFGLGRMTERDSTMLTMPDTSLGTLPYAAPEQVRDARDVDLRADIYSLGKLLYEMLTGELPYPQTDMGKIQGKYSYIIQKCTALDPGDRYQSVGELKGQFRLLTEPEELYRKPVVDIARKMMQDLLEIDEIDKESLKELNRLLTVNKHEEQLFLEVIPSMPDPVTEAYIAFLGDSFRELLRRFDEYVSRSLPFWYTDIVANFYAKVFRRVEDINTRKMILHRLLDMGYQHNRFHVRGVFCRLVASTTEPGDLMLAKEMLERNPDAARWCEEVFSQMTIPTIIRQTLDELHQDF